MAHTTLITIAEVVAGFCIGFSVLYLLLKYKAQLIREKTEYLILKLPCLGKIRTRFRLRRKGIYMEELEEYRNRMKLLADIIDLELVHQYSEQYSIHYFGLEGDKADGSWSEGKLAYTTQNRGGGRKYNIFVNPHLNLEEISSHLSRQLGERIEPSEVLTFLLFHEIGHSAEAGNLNYYAEVMGCCQSNQKWSQARMKELVTLKSEIEQFADRFALAELKKLRRSCASLSPAGKHCGERLQAGPNGCRRLSPYRSPSACSVRGEKPFTETYSVDSDSK